MTLEKRDNWFKDYQDIPELGINGQRKSKDRISFFKKEDFLNSNVIDIGCNIGQMSFESEKLGAKKVLGVEYDRIAFEKALQIKSKLNSKVDFVLDDIDNPFFWRSLDYFDISLFLSVIDTQELKNKFGILSRLSEKTKKIMYFEGHNKQELNKYLQMLLDYTTFTKFEFLGKVEDERVLIRCSREILTTEECIKEILNCKNNKIAVIGKCNAGKSFIREKIELEMTNKGYIVVDDLKTENSTKWLGKDKIKNLEKIILFDYRALEYISDFETVFFITQSDLTNFRNNEKIVRSPTGNTQKIKQFLTVISR